jgi:hypothetical protein
MGEAKVVTELVDKYSRTLVINTLINTVPTVDVCIRGPAAIITVALLKRI